MAGNSDPGLRSGMTDLLKGLSAVSQPFVTGIVSLAPAAA
jgi:hypothetical protein